MTKIVLKNPYFEEEIKVKEDCIYIFNCLDGINFGHISCIQLHQIEPKEAFITINPKIFAKIEIYEEVE